MRKLTSSLFISLDGAVEAPDIVRHDLFTLVPVVAGRGRRLLSYDGDPIQQA